MLCCLIACLVNPATAQKAVVRGKIHHFKGESLLIRYQEYAVLEAEKKAEVPVKKDGSFRFEAELSGPARMFMILETSPVEERFTVKKADGRDTTITTSTNRSQIVYLYLTPGDRQRFEVNAGEVQQTLTFKGKNSQNSLYLNQEDWHFNQYGDKHLKNYFGYVNYSPEQYTQYVLGRRDKRLQFLEQFNRKDRLKSHLFEVSRIGIQNEAVTARLLYPGMRASYTKQPYEAPEGYYDFLDSVSPDTGTVDKGIAYFYFLDHYLKESHQLSGTDQDFLDYAKTRLSGRPLYEYYAFALGSNFKKKLYDLFGEDSPYPELAQTVKAKYKKLEGMLEGNPAPVVVLRDTTDRQITWSDLNGKYLYLDFWATWCGPCIAEIPSLEKLQHDYAGKNITFVSISVDKEKDKGKWKQFVADKNLKGEQLWADEVNSRIFTGAFNMQQIPRFVLLDPEGRIVDANAARPSDVRVRQLLDKVLN